MKKSQARKVLDKELDLLTKSLAKLNYDSCLAKSVFLKEYEVVVKALSKGKQRSLWTALTAHDIGDPSLGNFPISGEAGDNLQFLEKLILSFNQQHLWILVSAFEEFERYLKNLYGALGYLDRALWVARDFGAVSIKEIGKKKLDWHLMQVRKNPKMSSSKDIRKRLLKLFPLLGDPCFASQSDWLGVLEQYRHAVVHQGGRVELQEFLSRIEKAVSPNSRKAILLEVPNFIKEENGVTRIWVIGKEDFPLTLSLLTSPYEALFNLVTDSALYYYRVALDHFGEKPKWVAP